MPARPPSLICIRWPARRAAAVVLCCAASSPVQAQASEASQPPAVPSNQVPLSMTLGFERVALPGDEHMGLVGASVLFDIGAQWWAGPAVYGAASGERGGLFVGGIELQRRWSVAERMQLVTGLYAGGGGGAAAPVGGGLMLRPALSLLREFGPLQAGVSWSHVRFPSGRIDSSQLGLVLAWDGSFGSVDPALAGQRVRAPDRSGLGFDRVVGTLTRYHMRDGSGRNIGLVGTRMEQRVGYGGAHWGLEAAAAAQGNAAGYMELLGSAGHDWALWSDGSSAPRVGVRVALGLGGGGAVPTGGGVIGKAALTLAAEPTPGWRIGAEQGVLRGTRSRMRASTTQLWVSADLEPARPLGWRSRSGPVVRTEWSGTVQSMLRARRNDGSRRALETVGLKLNRYVAPWFYVSGQAHSAFAGGAGAFSIGLLGAGVATLPEGSAWQVGAEVLAGAAGGAGVSTSGGAIVQGLGWLGWSAEPTSQWRLGAGAVRSLNGALRSPVLELAWVRRFGQPGR